MKLSLFQRISEKNNVGNRSYSDESHHSGIKSVPKISFVEIERESGEKISHERIKSSYQ